MCYDSGLMLLVVQAQFQSFYKVIYIFIYNHSQWIFYVAQSYSATSLAKAKEVAKTKIQKLQVNAFQLLL